MRKTIAAVTAVFALTLVAGCSSSSGDKKADDTTTTAKTGTTDKTTETTEDTTETTEGSSGGDTVAVEDWADDFCGSFKGWISEIQDASSHVQDNVTQGDIESAKTAIVGLFDDASSTTESLIDDIDQAGVPDIDDGDGLVEDLKGKFQDFDDAILAAKADAEALSTDGSTFQADVGELVQTFQDETKKVGDSFSELDAKYQSQELNDALSSSCDLS